MLAEIAETPMVYVVRDEDETIHVFDCRPFRRETPKGIGLWACYGKELAVTPFINTLAANMDYYDSPFELKEYCM